MIPSLSNSEYLDYMLYRIIFFFFFCLNGQLCFGQQAIQSELYKVGVEKGLIKTWIKAVEAGKPAPLKRDQIILTENYKGQENILKVFSIEDTLIKETLNVEESTVLFLLDVSSYMDDSAIEEARRLITQIINKYELGSNVTFYLTAFDETKVLNRKAITTDNLDGHFSILQATKNKPDFNRILINEIHFLKEQKGKKLLFVMGSGSNDVQGLEIYNNMIPYDSLDIRNNLNERLDDFVVFSIGLGKQINRTALMNLVTDGAYYNTMDLPEAYGNVLQDNVIVHCTHLVRFRLEDDIFQGEKRNYTMQLAEEPSILFSLRYGSTSNPISILSKYPKMEWIFWFLFGLMLIVVILLIGSTLVPAIMTRNFISKYVSKYIPEGQVRVNDPVYNEPIQAGELVVKRCQQLVPLSTWEDVGRQCPNYPDCMDPKYLGCNGAGAPLEDNFFSRKGIFNQLNWMWYGAIGGFLAWILMAILNIVNFQGLQVLIAKVLKPGNAGIPEADSADPERFRLYVESLNNDLLLGMSFGIGLMFMLAYIVELSDSRQLSWKKIIVRTLFSMVFSLVVFYIGFYLQYGGLVPNGYSSGLITWLLFGLSVGLILSIRSNILVSRGVIGGLLASFIAFNVYIGISTLGSNYISAKLISLIVLGAILGLVLVTVISSLENFELEFIAPKGLQNIPISKWLKNSQIVFIGKEPGSYVYVKWDDPSVLPKHAQLKLENGTVYIQPMGETIINGKIIDFKKRTPLKNKDLIQLGRESTTILRYKEKRTSK